MADFTLSPELSQMSMTNPSGSLLFQQAVLLVLNGEFNWTCDDSFYVSP